MIIESQKVRYGLGDTRTAAGTIVSTTATGAKIGSAIAPGIGTAIGAAAGAIAGTITALLIRQGPKQKVLATKDVDAYEPYLQANLASFQAGQVSKVDALQTFDILWEKLATELSQAQLGEPGRRALQERGRNGTPPWGANWYQLYRDPIDQAAENPLTSLIPTGLLPEFTETVNGEEVLAGWVLPVALIMGALIL